MHRIWKCTRFCHSSRTSRILMENMVLLYYVLTVEGIVISIYYIHKCFAL
jgi:hypothetical protein